MESTEERVRRIVVEQLGLDASEVTINASFVDDLGVDSLDWVEIVMAVEIEFGVEIPDAEAEELLTVGKAVAYIDARLAAKTA